MGYIDPKDIIEPAFAEARRLIDNQNRKSQPFRNRFEHTMRVLKWAHRIHQVEGGNLEVITLAIFFHDSGWSDTIDHALVGAKLAEKYLLENVVDPILVDRVVSAVRTHNKRTEPYEGLPLENLIVMDADLLDELGITTLVWDAMATATGENPSYVRALEKDLEYYERAKGKMVQFKTEAGRKFYNERMNIWNSCLSHLQYELGLSDEFIS